MGVKELWSVLAPVCEERPLSDFEGQTLAVDLATWVVGMQTAVRHDPSLENIYLRNVFCRAKLLLHMDMRLLFVTEGKVPALKRQAMISRQASRGGGGGGGGRGRFQADLNKCTELLEHMGLAVFKAEGEAEATCAALNKDGLADAVLTEDGDAFLYGASVVLRKFSLEGNRPMIECYRMERIENELKLDRHKLVALALLTGCDYSQGGLPNVGIVQARRFLKNKKSGKEILASLRNARKAEGATDGSTVIRLAHKQAGFPDEQIIDEFLRERSIPAASAKLHWRQPNLLALVAFMKKHLEWAETRTVENVVPLISLRYLRCRAENSCTEETIRIEKIVKARIQKKIAHFEVQWHRLDVDQITEKDYYVILEKSALMEVAFFDLVEQFRSENTRRPKIPSPAKRTKRKLLKGAAAAEASPEKESAAAAGDDSLRLVPDSPADDDDDDEGAREFERSFLGVDSPHKAAVAQLNASVRRLDFASTSTPTQPRSQPDEDSDSSPYVPLNKRVLLKYGTK